MHFNTTRAERVVRIATIATLSFMVCWELVTVLLQIKPFWVDEWRVIYNLKFKDARALWGPLDFMQQFPRVYLEIVKAFTEAFNYSYTMLRLPSFVVGTATILLGYRLMKRLYPSGHLNRFLFVMILVSYCTFTDYYVQVKQYTMDMLLSLLAIWQLLELLKLPDRIKAASRGRYILLCISFLIVPFFSYIYPIVAAPVFMVLFFQSMRLIGQPGNGISRKRILALQWFPVLLGTISIIVFYVVDVSQLMKDQGMHEFWEHIMMKDGFSLSSFLYSVYNLFAAVGAGLIYWYVFGIVGSISFLFGIYKCAVAMPQKEFTQSDFIRLYAVLLLLSVIVLFLAGKLPVGEPRLSAFTVPATSILIICFFDALQSKKIRFSNVPTAILYIGAIGNIYTTFFASITGTEYNKKMNIYRSTESAIVLAQAKKLPILVTPGVAYPYDKTVNLPFKGTVPGDWVLKTFPAYSAVQNLPVYAIDDLAGLKQYMKLLPLNITDVLVGDGRSFRIVRRE